MLLSRAVSNFWRIRHRLNRMPNKHTSTGLDWDAQSIRLQIAHAYLCHAPAPMNSSSSAGASTASPITSAPSPASVPQLSAGIAPVADEAEEPGTSLRILELLKSKNVEFSTLEHAPTRTSEESAAVRGVSLASGSKALFMKSKATLPHGSPYILAVMSAARKADLNALKKAVGSKNMGMASPEEVWELTRCRPGAVPPFGSLFAGVKTVVDRSLIEQGPRINFNAGLRTLSVGMTVQDYMAVENPAVLEFTTA